MIAVPKKKKSAVPENYRHEVLEDYRTCCISRECSILARKEALSGKANFGIIGDGKEVAQVAMARSWKKGDFRSGYYRDQTLMFALGLMTIEEFFAQLYGDPLTDKLSSGRQMNCHFVTPTIDENGNWLDHKNRFNISSDISPTGGQMARGLGLAFASKIFRDLPHLAGDFSENGNEVCFVTIGDASTSEGVFWEAMNAAGVTQSPMAVSVWDDGYGISVPKKFQTTKESISVALSGMEGEGGIDIYTAKAWDYPQLRKIYAEGIEKVRKNHQPALFHIQEVTQQLGHSTSGDHRRYKSPERLQFEIDFDCNRRLAEWIVKNDFATAEELKKIEDEARTSVLSKAKKMYDAYHNSAGELFEKLKTTVEKCRAAFPDLPELERLESELSKLRRPIRAELWKMARQVLFSLAGKTGFEKTELENLIADQKSQGEKWYSTHLYSETEKSPLRQTAVPPVFSETSSMKDGWEILNTFFDKTFSSRPEVFAFGEDVGDIGDVNQGLRGMQQKHGKSRVFDTGIREWTIMGQAIGMAMRGLRPIAEIQYLDYLLYGLVPLSDDLCTLRWRTANQQAAPAIIRTRGHRLVGVWHSGSPMSLMLNALRGMWICVPRNMVQAAGMYQTLLGGDDPAIVVECLNGYRLKELMPENLGEFSVPLGQPEIIKPGSDLTLITYGSMVRIAEETCEMLENVGISVELIDVQTLMPFDLPKTCVESLKKTNRVLFLDEDFPGGATAYMMQEVLEKQGGYRFLDSAPQTLTAKQHRPAYANDGDYFSKPQVEDIFEAVYGILRESEPGRLSQLLN